MGADRVLVNVVAMFKKVAAIADAVVGKSALPDGVRDMETVGEAALDEHHCSFKGDVLWGKKNMNVVGHDNEGVEAIVAVTTVMLERFEEEFCVPMDLEETAAVPSLSADEERAVASKAGGLTHA